jgi:hypothetical protein
MTIISNCTASELKDAAASLLAGNLVAFPTETVYGLGADASNQQAVARIYEGKGRPTDHPLIVHISSINNLNSREPKSFHVASMSNNQLIAGVFYSREEITVFLVASKIEVITRCAISILNLDKTISFKASTFYIIKDKLKSNFMTIKPTLIKVQRAPFD